MKITTFLLIVFFLSVFQVQQAYSQKTEIKHSFKIVGSKSISILNGSGGKMSVEYDSVSCDHLYISEFNISEFRKGGFLETKTRLLFKGKNFNLSILNRQFEEGKLLVDGIQAEYREDRSIVSELLYNEGKLGQKTFYYPNGKKQMLICGNEKIMNGEYKVWYPNGQLNFSGTYKNNLKDGEFQ